MGSSADRPYDDLIARRQNDGLAITRVPPTPSEKHADRSARWTGLGITLFLSHSQERRSSFRRNLEGDVAFEGTMGPQRIRGLISIAIGSDIVQRQ